MRSFQIAALAASDVTEATLKSAPARALTFLQGAGEPAICGQLRTAGWNDAHVGEAWDLLNALRSVSVVAVPKTDPSGEAIAACEAWQGTGLVRARARLQLSFPEQGAFVFGDFAPGKGMLAVLNVATFLARRHALENGAARKGSRKVDHEALALLEVAGVTKVEVARLEGLVETAQKVVAPQVDPMEAQRLDVLRKIYAWLNAWSEIARTVITRRDQLIRLGIAKRRVTKVKSPVVAPPATPIVTAPAAPVPVALPPVAPAVTPTPPAVGGAITTPAGPMAPHVEEEVAPESNAA